MRCRRLLGTMLAYVNRGVLMDGDPTRTVDIGKTEANVRDVERGRAELQLVRVRSSEAVTSQLTPEQRTKLAALLDAAVDPAGLPRARYDITARVARIRFSSNRPSPRTAGACAAC